MDFVFQRTYRGSLKAVVLDWAGTTIDYGCCAPAAVFMEVYKRKGVEISVPEARGPMGAQKKDHIRQILQDENVARRWKSTHRRAPDERDVEEMYRDFIPLQLACLADYAELIPGTLATVVEMRRRGLKIGATTGYDSEMMAVVQAEAARRGYLPDCTVCATQVPAGRPHPYMCLQNAINLQTYPMQAFVKIGDTVPDIEEGLNAGMWSIGVAQTGNEIGLTEEQIGTVDPELLQSKLDKVYRRMHQAGAHYVVDGIGDVPPLLDEIDARLASGERP